MITVLLRIVAVISGVFLAIGALYFPLMKFVADVNPNLDGTSQTIPQIVDPFIQWCHSNVPILITSACMGFVAFLLLRFAIRGMGGPSDSSMIYPGID